MKHVIKAELNEASLKNAISAIDEYIKWIERKSEQLTQKLAEIGAMDATIRFENAEYNLNFTNDVVVTTEKIPNGFRILANGQSVAFVEFGAGVYADVAYIPQPDGGAFVTHPGAWSVDHARTYVDWQRSGKNMELYPYNSVPSNAMQNTVTDLQRLVEGIAKEVFES